MHITDSEHAYTYEHTQTWLLWRTNYNRLTPEVDIAAQKLYKLDFVLERTIHYKKV